MLLLQLVLRFVLHLTCVLLPPNPLSSASTSVDLHWLLGRVTVTSEVLSLFTMSFLLALSWLSLGTEALRRHSVNPWSPRHTLFCSQHMSASVAPVTIRVYYPHQRSNSFLCLLVYWHKERQMTRWQSELLVKWILTVSPGVNISTPHLPGTFFSGRLALPPSVK